MRHDSECYIYQDTKAAVEDHKLFLTHAGAIVTRGTLMWDYSNHIIIRSAGSSQKASTVILDWSFHGLKLRAGSYGRAAHAEPTLASVGLW